MTAVLIDANVLLDIMTEDTHWLVWSAKAIETAADRYRLVINPIIYAEVSIRYSRIEELDVALPKTMFDREAIPYEAAFLAGKAFLTYRRRGGAKTSSAPRFFYWCPCRRCWISTADTRCGALPHLFPKITPHCSGPNAVLGPIVRDYGSPLRTALPSQYVGSRRHRG